MSARFTKFARYFHSGVSFSGKEISLILKKQDGRHGHFFENYLHFSTGCFS